MNAVTAEYSREEIVNSAKVAGRPLIELTRMRRMMNRYETQLAAARRQRRLDIMRQIDESEGRILDMFGEYGL